MFFSTTRTPQVTCTETSHRPEHYRTKNSQNFDILTIFPSFPNHQDKSPGDISPGDNNQVLKSRRTPRQKKCLRHRKQQHRENQSQRPQRFRRRQTPGQERAQLLNHLTHHPRILPPQVQVRALPQTTSCMKTIYTSRIVE